MKCDFPFFRHQLYLNKTNPIIFPKQCGHAEGVLTVTAKGPVFYRGVHQKVRHFCCNFPHKIALVKCPCAVRLRSREQNVRPELGAQHFSCKFPYKMALVGLGSDISCKFQHKMALLTCPRAFGLSSLCSHMCAFFRLLSYVCSSFALICVLSYVCSRMCAPIYVL